MNTIQLIHDQGAGLIGSLGLTCAVGAIIAGLIMLCYGGAYLFDWFERRRIRNAR